MDLQIGPGGDLFYADFDGGSIRRIQFVGQPPPVTPGLVAAYSFDEGAGTTVADASQNGNGGTIGTATWSTQGRFGNALSFNGTNAHVTVADSSSLDLTTGMTLEAWVFPTAGGGWRDVMYKGQDDIYYLMSSSSGGQPATGGTFASPLFGPSALPLNAWSHLAATYDGQTLRLFRDGQQVASRAQTGPITVSTGALTIGGDALYGQRFAGRIDDVRVYNTALTQQQIQADMATGVGGPAPDTQAPTNPANLVATATAQTQVNLTWSASTDNVAVTGYRLERCQGASCSNFAQVATPSGTSYSDTGLQASTSYRYRVRAVDAAGNPSGYSNTATEVTQAPNTPPTASISSPVGGTTWAVGETISFAGSATDAEDGGPLPASAYRWELVLQHCWQYDPTSCHSHTVQNWNGVVSGSFSAEDHEYPAYLDLRLTATDSGGLTHAVTRRLDPRAVSLTFASSPTGLQLTVGSSNSTTPFTRTVIEGSTNSISAPSSQPLAGTLYNLVSWSDGGAASHNIVAAASSTYTATFQAALGPAPVAAYGFNEGSGTSTADASGSGNTGSIGSSTWTTQGRFGNALSFNGQNARVTINDSASLDLTTAMTLEAWVFPTVLGGWRDVVYKGPDDIYFLEGSSDGTGSSPATGGTFSGSPLYGTSGLPLNTWSHLASTYDGVTMRLYVNGAQVSSRPQTGQIATSTGALTIGGDATYGQHFAGRIDDVRVYKVALTQAQVEADMNTGIGSGPPPDTQPPTAPTALSATATSPTQINLAWTAATDDVGVLEYRIERCQGTGCSNLIQIATAAGTTFSDTGRSPSTSYSYRVRAEDTTNNLGPYSGTTSATTPATPDTQPPTAPTALSATATSPTQINLAWTAATDNSAVLQYRIERCQNAGCSNFTEIASTTGTSYQDGSRTPSTSYSYRVRAEDTALNLGPYSTTASAQTPAPPNQPPSAPSNLSATAISPSQINLAWTAATDDVGVLEYRIERCQGTGCSTFTQIATAAGTTFSDTGRSPSTSYSYRVRAEDTTNNLGPYSGTTSTTTPVGSGFANDTVVQNLDFVTTMEILPGGKMLMAEIGGTIRVVQQGANQPDAVPFNDIQDVKAATDSGLLDVALDPNFASNRYYYVFYARVTGPDSYRDRVSRFTAEADLNSTVAGSEVVLWQDDAPSVTDAHHGATVAFGPDGKLYISIGDCGNPSNAQSLTSYHGKVLRINPDGTIPPDNPFVDGAGGNKDEIWAYGFRNPFRFSFDSVTGNLYLGDVGGNNHSTGWRSSISSCVARTTAGPCARATAHRPA